MNPANIYIAHHASSTLQNSVIQQNGDAGNPVHLNLALEEDATCPVENRDSVHAFPHDAPTAPFQSAQGLHSMIFAVSRICGMDPLRCISVRKLRSRSLCRWGIRMIRTTILGHENPGSFIRGFISTGKFSVLVRIPDDFVELIIEHFMEEGKSREVATAMALSGPWYHIVDGGHLHAALIELIKDYSEIFGGFKWPVAVIDWQPPENIQAIARMCHEMQREVHLIDFTLPDAMQNLRDIIDTQCKRQGITLVPGERVRNGFIKEVMAIYSGRPGFADNTMRNICGIVVKLSSEVVYAIRLLLTEECDDYCKQLGVKSPFGMDTRVYKKLLSSQSLKGVKPFLNGSMKDADKINVIHRLRFLARERECFKSFTAAEVEKQCQCVIDARNEVSKFEDFISEDGWPKEMENLKRNILQTTLLDRDINEHVGAGNEMLPALVDAYIKATGAHGSQKLGLFRRRMAAVDSRTTDQDGANESELPRNATHDDRTGMETCTGGDRRFEGGVGGEKDKDSEDPNWSLTECGVYIHRRTILDFERNSVDLERNFDFIIAEPFQKIPGDDREETQDNRDNLADEKGVNMFLQCLRRLLVPGGYCFIFLEWKHMHQWASCCARSQFVSICDPLIITKDATRIQKMTMKGLQTIYDPALVIKKPGKHPSGFTVDKSSPYHHLPACRMPRWCNVIDGVPPPAERLTFRPSRAHVRPTEKPCSLFIELFQTFCPEQGRVLDPRAGALTTGLASISTNRKCVLLETDEKRLSFALSRLRDFAKAKLSKDGMTSRPEGADSTAQQSSSDEIGEETNNRADSEGNAASITTDVDRINKFPIGLQKRGSGYFSVVVSEEGSPSHGEEIEGLETAEVSGEQTSELEENPTAVLKRRRFRRMSSESSQRGDGSPDSYCRSKRHRTVSEKEEL